LETDGGGMRLFGTAVVLAGGKSSRMGFDKAFLEIGGKTIIESIVEKLGKAFNDIVVVTNTPHKYEGLGARIVSDILKDSGPLGGIHSGLRVAKSRYAFIVACDMPMISLKYAGYMMDIVAKQLPDAVITCKGDWFEPFHSFYSTGLMPAIEDCVKSGAYKILDALEERNVVRVNEEKAREYSPDLRMFFNINNLEDLEWFLNYKGQA
jgi:molybdopterin-guanine dinucleotide biosynthesis protein A